MSPRGLGALLSWELAALLFAPVLVAIRHSAVAMGENTTQLANLEGPAFRGAWLAYGMVVGGYIASFLLCYLVAQSGYRRRLLGDVAGPAR